MGYVGWFYHFAVNAAPSGFTWAGFGDVVDNHYLMPMLPQAASLSISMTFRHRGGILLNSPGRCFPAVQAVCLGGQYRFQIAVAIQNLVLLILCAYNLKIF